MDPEEIKRPSDHSLGLVEKQQEKKKEISTPKDDKVWKKGELNPLPHEDQKSTNKNKL